MMKQSEILLAGKKKPINSIQSNLIIWLTIPLLSFTLILFLYIYYVVEKKVTNFFDNRLIASAKSIEQSIGIENSKLFIDMHGFSIDLFNTNDKGLIYYSVVDENNKLLIGHKYLLNKKILRGKDSKVYFTSYDGVRLRTVTIKTSISSAGKIYNAYITLGETTEERDENIKEALGFLSLIILIVIISSLAITILSVIKGLEPLKKLKKTIKDRDDRDLEPLSFNAPKELEDVVKSINILLERSRNTIEYIEQFNSDVSHQLRTPLAEMKVKLEDIFSKKDKNYIALNGLLNNMSHITEQLLLYAKTNPNTINLKRFKLISLNDICKEYSIKTAPRVYQKGFEFAFENLDENIFIKADSILLESMMDNLINNALHYAVDDKGNPIGTITLSLERHNNTIWLNIKDEGKGVEKKSLKTIFDRYHRVDSSKAGSGLGLSIVKQIANLHHAKVIAQNENGLKISIIFDYKKRD